MVEQRRETHDPQKRDIDERNKTSPVTSGLISTQEPEKESTKKQHAGRITKSSREPPETKGHSFQIGNLGTGAPGITASTMKHESTMGLSSPKRQGIPIEVLAGGIAGGLSILILIAAILFVALIKRRRKSDGLIIAQSNTDTSFDNLGFTGGRKISEYMDLTELELVKVKVTNTVKRKISTFTKEDQKTREVSCGRLDLVEVPANTDIDSDVLLTTWV